MHYMHLLVHCVAMFSWSQNIRNVLFHIFRRNWNFRTSAVGIPVPTVMTILSILVVMQKLVKSMMLTISVQNFSQS